MYFGVWAWVGVDTFTGVWAPDLTGVCGPETMGDLGDLRERSSRRHWVMRRRLHSSCMHAALLRVLGVHGTLPSDVDLRSDGQREIEGVGLGRNVRKEH